MFSYINVYHFLYMVYIMGLNIKKIHFNVMRSNFMNSSEKQASFANFWFGENLLNDKIPISEDGKSKEHLIHSTLHFSFQKMNLRKTLQECRILLMIMKMSLQFWSWIQTMWVSFILLLALINVWIMFFIFIIAFNNTLNGQIFREL